MKKKKKNIWNEMTKRDLFFACTALTNTNLISAYVTCYSSSIMHTLIHTFILQTYTHIKPCISHIDTFTMEK